MSEERGALIQSCQGFEDEGIRYGGFFDMMREGEIEGIDDHGVRKDGSMRIILSGVDMVFAREGISRSHLCSRSNFPDNVEVLKEERPTSLGTRKFVGILQIGQVLMVSENRDRMRSSL